MIRKFSLFDQKATDGSPYAPDRVIAIASASDLLKPAQRRALLKKIKTLVKAPEKYYNALYEPLIDNLANYVQSLPDIRTIHDPDHAIEWLDSALSRAAYAVSVRHRMILPFGADAEKAEIEYPLWTYVVFSSALLWQIGKLSSHYSISICNQQGMVTRDWNPMTTSLQETGRFYKIRAYDQHGSDTFKHITPMLARHIMPDEGFAWIASNDEALKQWLAALVDEEGASGSIVSIITIARMILENHPSLKGLLEQLEILKEELDALIDELKEIEALEKNLRRDPNLPPVKISSPPETQAGEEFYQWLKRGLENGTIAVNSPKAHVHITKEGVILAFPEIFQDFVREFHRYKDWILVYKQFNALGITKMSGGDTWFGKFFVEKPAVPSPLEQSLRGRYSPIIAGGPTSREKVNRTDGPNQPQNAEKANQSKNIREKLQIKKAMADKVTREVKGMQVETKKLYGKQSTPELSTIISKVENKKNVKHAYPKLPNKNNGPKNNY